MKLKGHSYFVFFSGIVFRHLPLNDKLPSWVENVFAFKRVCLSLSDLSLPETVRPTWALYRWMATRVDIETTLVP